MPHPSATSSLAGTRFTDIRWFPELDSTNRYLLAEARAGAPEGVVAVADFQSQGRGRLGRAWTAPPGASLLVSVLLRPPLPPDQAHLVTAAMALATRAAAEAVAGVVADLKWPNDLLVGGRKLGGILAEADVAGGRIALVVGLGLNVNWPEELPGELTDIAVSLDRVAGRAIDRRALLEEILRRLDAYCDALTATDGRRRVASEYRRACATIGRPVRVDLVDESFTGTAADVTDDGHLLVDVGMCLRTVTAGDVVHLRALGRP